MEELLESFLSAALGLELKGQICDAAPLPELMPKPADSAADLERLCAAWHIAEGRVSICATYHHGHSQRVKHHVLMLGMVVA